MFLVLFLVALPGLTNAVHDGIAEETGVDSLGPQLFGGISIPRQHFHLFLKECEWRFNGGSPNDLLRTLKQWVKIRSQGNI